MTIFSRLREFGKHHKLVFAIGGATVLAFGLVTFSMILYTRDDVSRLDVSRPAYQKVRDSLINGDDSTFSASGPLNASDIESFQKLLTNKKTALSNVGAFSDNTIDDEQLQLNPTP